MTDLVLTLLGPDRPGLVELVAGVIAAHGGNWLESRMSRLAGKFAGILRAELPPDRRAGGAGGAGGAGIARPQGDRRGGAASASAGAGDRSMDLELVGLDRPGIVREISQLLAASGVNVEELVTNRTSAPMSGEMLFEARAHVRVPAGTRSRVAAGRAGTPGQRSGRRSEAGTARS